MISSLVAKDKNEQVENWVSGCLKLEIVADHYSPK